MLIYDLILLNAKIITPQDRVSVLGLRFLTLGYIFSYKFLGLKIHFKPTPFGPSLRIQFRIDRRWNDLKNFNPGFQELKLKSIIYK
jgi:hypothetical protein